MRVIAVLLSLLSVTPSAATFAAVALFAANVDRKWPADDRAPAVNGEALRLMSAATKAIGSDFKISDDKWRDAMADFDTDRDALAAEVGDEERRAELVRDTLDSGRKALERLASAMKLTDRTTKGHLDALKTSIDKFDRDTPARQQGEVFAEYFREAAALLKSMLDAPPSTLTSSADRVSRSAVASLSFR